MTESGEQPSDNQSEGTPPPASDRGRQALGVVAVFVALQFPLLIARLATGLTSPVAHVLAAVIAGVIVLLIDRMSRAGATAQAAEQVEGRIAAAVQRAEQRTRDAAEEMVEMRAGAASTIARRSRDLLANEFEIIDRLEAEEEDGERLSDLFKLDHLATRMNRNVSSMLVLAGGWPTRVVDERPAMSEILRAGVGEVQDYARVEVGVALDPDVDGNVVGPLIHMIAELLDWMLQHEAGTVSLRGSAGSAGTYQVQVAMRTPLDQAADAELAHAFAGAPNAVPSNSEQLGLHLVALLAAGLAARVGREHGEDGGTVLTIDLPSAALEKGVTTAQRRDRTNIGGTLSPVPASPPPASGLEPTAPADGRQLVATASHTATTPFSQTEGPAAGVASSASPVPVAAAHAGPSADAGPEPASAAARPSQALGWSYSGYVDGTPPETTGKWALGRGLRRRGKAPAPRAPLPPVRVLGTAGDPFGTEPTENIEAQ